mmetsp:Transcript_12776/g.19234  ORF Transcript_12776/g.19234 Transcript_12776/m.19234 type:complete len:157 (+) Transcript_12776:143-613(+)
MTSQDSQKHSWQIPRSGRGQMVKHRASRKVVYVVDDVPKYKTMSSLSKRSDSRYYRQRPVTALVEDWKRRGNYRAWRRRRTHTSKLSGARMWPSAPHNTSSMIMDMHNTPRHSLDQVTMPTSVEETMWNGLNLFGSFLPQLTREDYKKLFNDDDLL